MRALKRLRNGDSAPVVAADLGVAPITVYMWERVARLGGKRAFKTGV